MKKGQVVHLVWRFTIVPSETPKQPSRGSIPHAHYFIPNVDDVVNLPIYLEHIVVHLDLIHDTY